MPPMPVVPDSLAARLSLLRPTFTAPTFDTFRWLVMGFVSRVGERTVCGMWQAVRLAGVFPHSRAHGFFAGARWSPDELGLHLADLLVARLVPAGEPLRLALDDTLFHRTGRKVFGACLHHDPHAGFAPMVFGLTGTGVRLGKGVRLRRNAQLQVAQNCLVLNAEMEPYDDVRVRQALNWVIDRARLAKIHGNPASYQILPEGIPGYIEGAKYYGHDPARARELLAEAGYPDGFTTTISLPAENDFRSQTAQAVQQDLREVGIDAKIEMRPAMAHWPELATSGTMALGVSTWFMDFPDPYDWIKPPVLPGSRRQRRDEHELLVGPGSRGDARGRSSHTGPERARREVLRDTESDLGDCADRAPRPTADGYAQQPRRRRLLHPTSSISSTRNTTGGSSRSARTDLVVKGKGDLGPSFNARQSLTSASVSAAPASLLSRQ